jgi:hypothetical protein
MVAGLIRWSWYLANVTRYRCDHLMGGRVLETVERTR